MRKGQICLFAQQNMCIISSRMCILLLPVKEACAVKWSECVDKCDWISRYTLSVGSMIRAHCIRTWMYWLILPEAMVLRSYCWKRWHVDVHRWGSPLGA